MLRASLAVLAAIGLAGIVQALPGGAPSGACQSLRPLGHTKKANTYDSSKDAFSIASACYVFMPGESMLMTIWPKLGDGDFKGIITQVRRVDPDEKDFKKLIAGKFTTGKPLSQNFKTMKCGLHAGDTVTHKSRADKAAKGQFYRWTAPATCKESEEYEIRATVLKSYSYYQTDIVIPLVCNPDYSNYAIMNRVRPPLVSQYCSVQSWASIPKGLTTGFETGFDGWTVNKIGDWQRRDTPTPTPGTGPDAAHRGKWYVHYEATGKPTGHTALFYTKELLEGCFCFSLWCHMRTDGNVVFRARAFGAGINSILATTTEVTNFWREVKVNVLTEYPVGISIEVTRANTDRADIGIDTISVKPGRCDGKNIPDRYLTPKW